MTITNASSPGLTRGVGRRSPAPLAAPRAARGPPALERAIYTARLVARTALCLNARVDRRAFLTRFGAFLAALVAAPAAAARAWAAARPDSLGAAPDTLSL